MAKISISTIFTKLKTFKKRYINKYTCILNYEKLGYNVIIKGMIKVKKNNKSQLLQFLKNSISINNIDRINNGYDIHIEGIFQSINQAETFIENLEQDYKIQKNHIFYVIDKIKQEGFLTS